MSPQNLLNLFKRRRNAILVIAAIFLVSVIPLPLFWNYTIVLGLPLRIILWIISAPLMWVTRISGERIKSLKVVKETSDSDQE